jgi:exonuclease III
VKEKKPDMVFLMETKFFNKNCDFLCVKLGYDHMFVVDSVGRSGGLILLWRNKMDVSIQNYSRRHINVVVTNGRLGNTWKFMGFYGHLDTAKRKEAWDLLRHLSHFQPLPWLCIGDFNEILDLSGKKKRKKKRKEKKRKEKVWLPKIVDK